MKPRLSERTDIRALLNVSDIKFRSKEMVHTRFCEAIPSSLEVEGFPSSSRIRDSSRWIFSCRICVLVFVFPSSYSQSAARFARLHCWHTGLEPSHFILRLRQLRQAEPRWRGVAVDIEDECARECGDIRIDVLPASFDSGR